MVYITKESIMAKKDNIAEELDMEPIDLSTILTSTEATELNKPSKKLLLTSDAPIIVKKENDGLLAPIKEQEITVLPDDPDLPDLDNDYKQSRTSMKLLLEKGHTILDRAMSTAVELDTPRGHEVAAKVLKDLSDIITSFYNIQKTTKEIKQTVAPGRKAEGGDAGGGVNINKATVFVGTPQDLFKQLDAAGEGNFKDITPPNV
jgi:hypothetical protein